MLSSLGIIQTNVSICTSINTSVTAYKTHGMHTQCIHNACPMHTHTMQADVIQPGLHLFQDCPWQVRFSLLCSHKCFYGCVLRWLLSMCRGEKLNIPQGMHVTRMPMAEVSLEDQWVSSMILAMLSGRLHRPEHA